MLVLTRKINQSIIIGDKIEVMVLDVKGEQVKIGIQAPRSISVHRKEVYEEIQRENLMAATSQVPSKDIEKEFKKSVKKQEEHPKSK